MQESDGKEGTISIVRKKIPHVLRFLFYTSLYPLKKKTLLTVTRLEYRKF
jgi:hypothetical protein